MRSIRIEWEQIVWSDSVINRKSRQYLTGSSTCVLGILGCLVTTTALADESKDGNVVLDPVEVIAETEKGRGYVSSQAASASKTGASILETPQSTSVITEDELRDRNVQSVTEALGYTSGVFASTSAISQRFDYFSIRGFDATLTGIHLDGLRSTTNQSYVRYQPYGMERADVVHGPSSVLYGGGSLGGVVNMISKRPTEESRGEVGVQYGSHDRLQGQFDLSGSLDADKKFLYRVVGVGRDSDTQFSHVEDNTVYLAPSLTWKPNNKTELSILTSYSRDEFGPPRPFVPIKGTLLSNPNGKLPRNVYLDDKGLDNDNIQANVAYDFEHRIDDTWRVQSKSRYAYNDLMTQSFSGMSLAADNRTLNRTPYEFGITGKVFSTDNNVRADWQASGLNGSSTVGVAYRHTLEDYYLNGGSNSTVDIYNPVYGASFSASSPMARTEQTGDELGVYLANTVTVADHFVIDLAGRQDWAWVDTDDLLKDTTTSQNDHDFTYRVGMTYLTDFGVAPYVSYATSFSPVTGTDFYGKVYKPTTGKQIEAGVKYQPEGMDALFTLAWFDLVRENVKTTDPDNSRNQIQTGEVESRGLEFSAKANLTESARVTLNYTYNDLEISKTTTASALGKRPTGDPEHMASAWVDYTFNHGPFDGLGLGVGGRYIGKTYADGANTISVPSYALLDAAIRYEFGAIDSKLEGMKLSVNATNLLNKDYYSGCSSRSCNQGYDRSVIATLSYAW